MYILDTNLFVQAGLGHYTHQLTPGYWRWLEKAVEQGIIKSIGAVYREIVQGKDSASDWAKQHKHVFENYNASSKSLTSLATWAHSQQFYANAVADFLNVANNADISLIAYCMDNPDATVVTYEQSNPHSKKRILIPDVCQAFNIRVVEPRIMLFREKVQFHIRT